MNTQMVLTFPDRVVRYITHIGMDISGEHEWNAIHARTPPYTINMKTLGEKRVVQH